MGRVIERVQMRAEYNRLQWLLIVPILMFFSVQGQSQERGSPVEWQTFVVPDFGTSMQIPTSIFAPAGMPEKGIGQSARQVRRGGSHNGLSGPTGSAEPQGSAMEA